MEDMISIIIPIYNRQDVIKECIDSIVAQSYQNFEIIIIDDGSTDQTVEVCQDLAKDEPRIKLIIAEHGGVSAARNVGLKAVKGEYVFFIDSDDIIHPLLLEALLTAMKNNNADIGGTDVTSIGEKRWSITKELIEKDCGPAETTYQTKEETLKVMFTKGLRTPLTMIGGIMMKSELIEDTEFKTDIYIGEDFYFIYENVIKGASSIFLKQKWYYSRLHKNNSSWDWSFQGFWTRFYRRELVWKSEMSFGRIENANCEKRRTFYIFLACLRRNKPNSTDSKKMCKVLKDYQKELFPALSSREKIHFYLSVYMTNIYFLLYKAAMKIKKLKKK